MAVSVSGAVLASLFYDHSGSDGDQHGFMIGDVFKHVKDTISDSQINNLQVETEIFVYECVPCPKDQKFYTESGKIQTQRISDLLKNKYKNIVGWYSFRRNSTLRPSFKEMLLHQNLAKSLLDDRSMFTFLLCSAKASNNKSTHSFDHTFLQIANNVFKRMAVNVLNLGDTTHREYKHVPSHSTSSCHGLYSKLVEEQEEHFLNNHGQVEIKKIQALNGALGKKLEEISRAVVGSEVQLNELEQEVQRSRKQIQLKLLEKKQQRRAEGILSQEVKKAPSVDDILSMDFDFIDADSGLKDDCNQADTADPLVVHESGAKPESLPLIRSDSGTDNVNASSSKSVRLSSPVPLKKDLTSSVKGKHNKDVKSFTLNSGSKLSDSCLQNSNTATAVKKTSDPFEFVSGIIADSKADEKFMNVPRGMDIKLPTDGIDHSETNKHFDDQSKKSNRGQETFLAEAHGIELKMKTRGRKGQKSQNQNNSRSNQQGDTDAQMDSENDEMKIKTDSEPNKTSECRLCHNNVCNCSKEGEMHAITSEAMLDDNRDSSEMDVSSSPVY